MQNFMNRYRGVLPDWHSSSDKVLVSIVMSFLDLLFLEVLRTVT